MSQRRPKKMVMKEEMKLEVKEMQQRRKERERVRSFLIRNKLSFIL